MVKFQVFISIMLRNYGEILTFDQFPVDSHARNF